VDDLAIARAVHVLAVVHWIGGLGLVTLVILPAIGRLAEPERRLAIFEEIERRFSWQAKISVVLVGLSGLFMTDRLQAWDRFADARFWWMHLMVALWAIFSIILFVAEPLFLHDWFRRQATDDSDRSFAWLLTAHRVLLALAAATVAAAVLGTQGALF
jgi:uncharacterized membrane protein